MTMLSKTSSRVFALCANPIVVRLVFKYATMFLANAYVQHTCNWTFLGVSIPRLDKLGAPMCDRAVLMAEHGRTQIVSTMEHLLTRGVEAIVGYKG